MSDSTLSLAIGLRGAGRHPAAWRDPEARPDALLHTGYWRDAIIAAERAGADLVTLDDGFEPRPLLPGESSTAAPPVRTDLVNGRLDTVLIAARIAPLTTRIGLLPTVTVTHTEPFHTSKAVATLDYVSGGRAGVVLAVDDRPENVGLFGRRDVEVASDRAALHREAAEYAEVIGRLWDSWEDDAEIRDVATGRFIDRDRLHYIDFEGEFFSMRGPSITPRPPQGQPLIATTVSAGDQVSLELLGGSADIGFFTSPDDRATLDTVLAASDSSRREDLRLYDDLIVYLDDTQASAAGRRAQYDDWLGTHFDDGTQEFVGTAAGLADLVEERAGAAQGVRLHPAAIGHDLRLIADDLAPELRRRGLIVGPEAKPSGAHTLRETLGLRHPINRYSRTTVSGGVR